MSEPFCARIQVLHLQAAASPAKTCCRRNRYKAANEAAAACVCGWLPSPAPQLCAQTQGMPHPQRCTLWRCCCLPAHLLLCAQTSAAELRIAHPASAPVPFLHLLSQAPGIRTASHAYCFTCCPVCTMVMVHVHEKAGSLSSRDKCSCMPASGIPGCQLGGV